MPRLSSKNFILPSLLFVAVTSHAQNIASNPAPASPEKSPVLSMDTPLTVQRHFASILIPKIASEVKPITNLTAKMPLQQRFDANGRLKTFINADGTEYRFKYSKKTAKLVSITSSTQLKIVPYRVLQSKTASVSRVSFPQGLTTLPATSAGFGFVGQQDAMSLLVTLIIEESKRSQKGQAQSLEEEDNGGGESGGGDGGGWGGDSGGDGGGDTGASGDNGGDTGAGDTGDGDDGGDEGDDGDDGDDDCQDIRAVNAAAPKSCPVPPPTPREQCYTGALDLLAEMVENCRAETPAGQQRATCLASAALIIARQQQICAAMPR